MTALPIILRELTVAARRRETWILRLVFAVGIGAAFAFGLFLPESAPGQRGLTVLWSVAIAAFVLCLASGPYLTSDAISLEKREGTLGLLFLTPLNAMQIVVGKMFTHSLQVTYALLGTFPFLFLPVLLGGVLWDEILRLLLVLLLTLLGSLALGILWSTLAEEARSTAMGTLASVLLLAFLPWAWPFFASLAVGRPFHLGGFPQLSPMTLLRSAFEATFQAPGGPGLAAISGKLLFWTSAALHLLLGLAMVAVAGYLLPRTWRRVAFERPATPPPATPPKPAAPSPSPGWPGRPDGPEGSLVWLASRHLGEDRAWRMLRSGLLFFLGVMLLVSVTTPHWQEGFLAACCTAYALHLLTRSQASWLATRWLHHERRSGALELLLTTPVAEADILAAHHRALRIALRRPLRALLAVNIALELAVLLFWDRLHMDYGAGITFSTLFVGGALLTLLDFKAIGWIGLRESLRQPTPARAAGRAFGSLVTGAWIALGIAILVVASHAGRAGGASAIATIFAIRFAVCTGLDHNLIERARQWIKPGLRHRIAEN